MPTGAYARCYFTHRQVCTKRTRLLHVTLRIERTKVYAHRCACTLPHHTQTGVHNTNMIAACRLTHREDESLCPCVSMEAAATSMRTLPCLDTPHPRANLRLLSAGEPTLCAKTYGIATMVCRLLSAISPPSLRPVCMHTATSYTDRRSQYEHDCYM